MHIFLSKCFTSILGVFLVCREGDLLGGGIKNRFERSLGAFKILVNLKQFSKIDGIL